MKQFFLIAALVLSQLFSQSAFAKTKFYFSIVVTCPTCSEPRDRGILESKIDPFDTIQACKKGLRTARAIARKEGLKIISAKCQKL
jgi:hypothetical protein